MKSKLLLFFLLTLNFLINAQIPYPTSGNNFRNLINTRGVVLNDYDRPYYPTSIYSGALWLASNNPKYGLKLVNYGFQSSGYYFPESGPYETDINKTKKNRINFNKIWTVSGYEIQQHKEDFKDGKIDNPIPSIMAWAGRLNPHFETYNGFFNTYENQDLAPFKDIDNDGVYNPLQGDYPYLPQADTLHQPDDLMWCINSAHEQDKLKVEIQLLCWSYYRTNDNLLSNTNFFSYKITNKDNETLTPFYIGYNTDFEIGCYFDDYSGCSSMHNAIFGYNINDQDGNNSGCFRSPYNYFKKTSIPTCSVKFLNQKLTSYVVNYATASGSPVTLPTKIQPPSTSTNAYNVLKGLWSDGSPMTKKGYGNDYTNKDTTLFAFDGNPNNTSIWTMKTAKIDTLLYTNGVGSILLDSLPKNTSVTFDFAIARHYDSTLTTTAAQVDLMFNDFDKIDAYYKNQFSTVSNPIYCTDDCVFPGDANADGRADLKDYLTIVSLPNNQGNTRNGGINWTPYESKDWNKSTYYGVNLKHVDCDGDGILYSQNDIDILKKNFHKTKLNYQIQPDLITNGNNFVCTFSKMDSLNTNSNKSSFNGFLNINTPIENLRGITFELDFDKRYFSDIRFGERANLFIKKPKANNIITASYGIYKIAQQYSMSFLINDSLRNTKEGVFSPCTEVKFKNVRVVNLDGSINESLGARDIMICFSDILSSTNVVEEIPIEVFPNPFDNHININKIEETEIDYDLLNMQGALIKSGTISNIGISSIDTSDLPKGMFLLKCHSKGKPFKTFKVVKQ